MQCSDVVTPCCLKHLDYIYNGMGDTLVTYLRVGAVNAALLESQPRHQPVLFGVVVSAGSETARPPGGVERLMKGVGSGS